MSRTDHNKTHRRRGEALEQALLKATWAELQENGYRQLSFDTVAKRAGTSKAVLYRRWDNRLALVRAALRAHRPFISGPVPDTGSLRGDVLALLERMTQGMHEVPDIVWGMALDAIKDGQLGTVFRREMSTGNRQAMRAILQNAEARGELVAAAVPDRLITLPIDLTRHEMLFTGQPPRRETLVEIVDDIYMPVLKPWYGAVS